MKFAVVLSALSLSPALALCQTVPPRTSKPPATQSSVSKAPLILRQASGKPVTDLKISRDGKLLFLTANTGQIEVYALATHTLLREFKGGMGAYELAISPDGSEVASSTIDFGVSLNKIADGTQRIQFSPGVVGSAIGLDWSSTGGMIATASSNQVGLFDTSGKLLGKREGAIGVGPQAVAFSPDGTRLVAGWSDRTLVLYDTSDFEKTQFAFQGPKLKEVGQLLGHTGSVTSLAWSKDGKFLASGDASGLVQIWNFAAQKTLGTWTASSSAIESLAWAPSGASVAIATKALEGGAAVQIWDVAKNKAKLQWTHSQPVSSLAFAGDGQTVAVGDSGGEVSLVPISAFAWFKTGAAQPVDLTKPFVALPGNVETAALSWSRDGRLLASAGATQLQVRDLQSGAALRVPQSHTQQITHVTFAPNNTLLATSGYSGVEVADVSTQKVLWRHEGRAVTAGWTSDGTTLYVAAKKGQNDPAELAAFDAKSGTLQKVIGRLSGTSLNTPIAAQLSPDGKRIAVALLANYDRNLYSTSLEVWEVADTKKVWSKGLNGWCDAIAWSPDGKWLVAKAGDREMAYPEGDKFVPGKVGGQWFDAATGKVDDRKTRLDLPDAVEALVFSPDGQTLAVSFERGPAQLWDGNGALNKELENARGSVTSWAFSSDGKHLAAGGKGSPLRIWTQPF